MAYVIITGGGGFLGQCVATSLLTTKSIQRYSSTTESSTSPTETIPVEKIILGDIAFPPKLQPFLEQNQDTFVVKKTGHVSDSTYVTELYSEIPPTAQHVYIFHLDAVVSSDDECDFDLCMRVNFHGFLNMMEGARNHIFEKLKIVPKFLFASAGTTTGSGAPTDYVQTNDVISGASRATLHTTYGAIKACCELLLTDYSSRGFVAGKCVRQPTEVLGYNRTAFLPAEALSFGDLVGELKKMKKMIDPSSHEEFGKITYQANTFSSEVVDGFPTQIDAQRAMETDSNASISESQQQRPIAVGSSIQGTSIEKKVLPPKQPSSLQRALAKEHVPTDTSLASLSSKRNKHLTAVSKSSKKSIKKPLSSLQIAIQAKNSINSNPHRPVVVTDDDTDSFDSDTQHANLTNWLDKETSKTVDSSIASDFSSIAAVDSSSVHRSKSKKRSKPKKRGSIVTKLFKK